MADGRGVRFIRVDVVDQMSRISVVDVVSLLIVESYTGMGTTNPDLPDYQLILRRALLTYGLPEILASVTKNTDRSVVLE
jgi:hypothetical protein